MSANDKFEEWWKDYVDHANEEANWPISRWPLIAWPDHTKEIARKTWGAAYRVGYAIGFDDADTGRR